MLAARLVRRIEDHAEELTRAVLNDLATNPRTPSYHRFSTRELHDRVYDVYHHLGRTLGEESEAAIQATYDALGRQRFADGIPLHEVVYALILSKYHLRDYIRASGIVDSAMDLYQEEDLHIRVGRFFDKAIYFTVQGYEEALQQGPSARRA